MAILWNEPRQANVRDAYLDWSRLLGTRLDGLAPQRMDSGVEFEPIFVRLVGGDVHAARQSLRAALSDTTLMMDPHETSLLDERIADPAAYGALPDEYALYRRVGTSDAAYDSIFKVIDTGVPVRLKSAPTAPVSPLQSVTTHGDTPGAETPIVAIIDDGIGFLNKRFCTATSDGGLNSRFHAVWLQALESTADSGGILAGRVLSRSQIDAMLSMPERDSYADLNLELSGPFNRPSTNFSTSHGTHVLDLAAGAEPGCGDPVEHWPLLAVQLPPEAVDDTSGTWFESYMVQGLRWILRQARTINPEAPVIVNLSLGVTAGPKNGTRFLEAQMAREAQNWEEITGQPVRLVWSFGNAYRNDVIARAALSGSTREKDLSLRVLPDDFTASFVEIRANGGDMSALTLTIASPDGVSSPPLTLQAGQVCSLAESGKPVARLYHVPERETAGGAVEAGHYVLALAPTRARKTGEPVAQPGAWRITVASPEDADVILQVQRDDALGGSRLRGRQAYFDDAESYGWDAEVASYVGPADGATVQRNGSFNALASASPRQVFCVGAARWSPSTGQSDGVNFKPAFYSAAGCEWSINGPTASALVDPGTFAGGTRAAGTLTGSCRRSGGTSAAAGRLSRALGLSAALIAANAKKGGTKRIADFSSGTLDLFAVEDDAERLGQLVVTARDSGPGAVLPL